LKQSTRQIQKNSLGKDLVVMAPQAVAAIGTAPGAPDNMFVHVMSAADNNAITFDPPVHPDVLLGAGRRTVD